MVCLDRFELITDESVDEVVESARGMFGIFDDVKARGLVR